MGRQTLFSYGAQGAKPQVLPANLAAKCLGSRRRQSLDIYLGSMKCLRGRELGHLSDEKIYELPRGTGIGSGTLRHVWVRSSDRIRRISKIEEVGQGVMILCLPDGENPGTWVGQHSIIDCHGLLLYFNVNLHLLSPFHR